MKVPSWFKDAKVIGAIIGLVGVLIVGYLEFVYKPSVSIEEPFQGSPAKLVMV